MPTDLADILGYYEEAGLTVERVTMRSGGQQIAALQSGVIDFGASSLRRTIEVNSQGGSMVATFVTTSTVGITLLVRNDFSDQVKTIQDLAAAGLKVGVTSLGSGTDLMLRSLYARSGLDPATVEAVPVGLGATAVAALRNDLVQAVVQTDPTTSLLVAEGEATILSDTRTIEGCIEAFGGLFPGSGLLTTQDFLETNKGVVDSMSQAVARALEYIQTHTPEEVVDQLPEDEYYPTSEAKELLIAAIAIARENGFAHDGTITEDMLTAAVDVGQYAEEPVDISNMDLSTVYYNGWSEAG